MFRKCCCIALALGAFVFVPSITVLADGNWPGWRGPRQDGHSSETNIPVKWDAKSVVWQTPLKGDGQSSAVIWGNRIFLTTALQKGKERLVFCIDRTNGNMLWEQVAWQGEPEKSHKMNGWASATCVTDGERVYAFFGKGGLHCYTVTGKKVWSRDLGEFPGPWGTSASPVLIGDLLIQNCDSTGESFLLAVNKKTGETVWKTPRPKLQRGGWSTPVLVETKNRKELVVNGEKAVHAYDAANGKLLWWCGSTRGRGEPTVTVGNGLLFVLNGQPGDMYAARSGGSGDVTKTHMAWHSRRRNGRDQPSPIVIGDYLLVVSMSGIATCYDSRTGKTLWSERLDARFSSSPIAAGGRAYFQSESGDAYVIEPRPKAKIIGQNSLGTQKELFRASLTPSRGQIFARSNNKLYCIDSRKSSTK